MSKEYEEFEVQVIAETDQAVRLAFDIFEGEEFWVPFSVIEDNGEPIEEDWMGTLYIESWFVQKLYDEV